MQPNDPPGWWLALKHFHKHFGIVIKTIAVPVVVNLCRRNKD